MIHKKWMLYVVKRIQTFAGSRIWESVKIKVFRMYQTVNITKSLLSFLVNILKNLHNFTVFVLLIFYLHCWIQNVHSIFEDIILHDLLNFVRYQLAINSLRIIFFNCENLNDFYKNVYKFIVNLCYFIFILRTAPRALNKHFFL